MHIEPSFLSLKCLKIGYREGITSGKENVLQEGFDHGFKTTGAPVGRQLGILRGTVTGILGILQNMKPSQRFPAGPIEGHANDILKNELQTVSSRLDALRLKDIAPKDPEAEAHAREHMDIEKEGEDDAMANAIMELGVTERPDGMKELAAIQQQLQRILEQLGLQAVIRI
jgi:hypothetical protein